jgi:hypothetical protein
VGWPGEGEAPETDRDYVTDEEYGSTQASIHQ